VLLRAIACGLLLLAALPIGAQSMPSDRPRTTSAADLEAITQVTVAFRAALAKGDVSGLSSLLVDKGILFASPPSPSVVKTRRERGNTEFTGAESGGFAAFAAFVAGSSVPLEEKFHNIKVTQDGHLAWVMFDFEFLAAGKVENYGVESWQMIKTPDDQWKIMSVVWSSHGAPK